MAFEGAPSFGIAPASSGGGLGRGLGMWLPGADQNIVAFKI